MIDELPRLGWWVEIEGPDVKAIEAARRRLNLADRALAIRDRAGVSQFAEPRTFGLDVIYQFGEL